MYDVESSDFLQALHIKDQQAQLLACPPRGHRQIVRDANIASRQRGQSQDQRDQVRLR